MITLEDVKNNEEVKALIEATRKAITSTRLYRTYK